MDIQTILKSIAEHGLSDSEIARRVYPCSQPTIHRLRVGVTKDCMSALKARLELLLTTLNTSETQNQ
jgi:predicted transcriptional regulator